MSVTRIEDELGGLKNCGLSLLIDELIGTGATRRVYSLKHNPFMVLKLEHASKEFCNVAEYEIWKEVNGTPLAKYFARAVDIDQWGGALLMMRTTPITEKIFRRRAKDLPDFMGDLHWENFGTINGRLVCHDYGYHDAIHHAVKRGKLARVKHDGS